MTGPVKQRITRPCACRRRRASSVRQQSRMSYKPAELLGIVRQRWGKENTLHWTLDVVLDEDLARSRKDNAPANLAVLRRLALNNCARSPQFQSLHARQAQAGWMGRRIPPRCLRICDSPALQAQPANAAKLIPWVWEHKIGPSRTIELPHFRGTLVLHP